MHACAVAQMTAPVQSVMQRELKEGLCARSCAWESSGTCVSASMREVVAQVSVSERVRGREYVARSLQS